MWHLATHTHADHTHTHTYTHRETHTHTHSRNAAPVVSKLAYLPLPRTTDVPVEDTACQTGERERGRGRERVRVSE